MDASLLASSSWEHKQGQNYSNRSLPFWVVHQVKSTCRTFSTISVCPRSLCQFNWFGSPSGSVNLIQAPVSWSFPAVGSAYLTVIIPPWVKRLTSCFLVFFFFSFKFIFKPDDCLKYRHPVDWRERGRNQVKHFQAKTRDSLHHPDLLWVTFMQTCRSITVQVTLWVEFATAQLWQYHALHC